MSNWKKDSIAGMAFYLMLSIVITIIGPVSFALAAESGQAQLFQAISSSDRASVESYINDGKSLAVVNQANMSPLLAAMSNKRKEISLLLVENGADVNFARKHTGETPLFYAAGHGWTDIVQLLLQKGAAIEAVDRFGWTPLTAAVFDRRSDTVKVLLTHKADVNHADNQGITPLMFAAKYGDVITAELLLAHGAEPTLKDEDGRTAIQYAIDKGHTDIVKLLSPKPPKMNE